MLARYQRNRREVEAILFDGSAASAAEISAAFGGSVSHDGAVLEVHTGFGRVFAGMGCWIARDCRSHTLQVIDHREFDLHFEPMPEVLPFNPLRPRAERWDVA